MLKIKLDFWRRFNAIMEKISKYRPPHWELQQSHPDYKVTQHNIIIDVLRGYSQDLAKTLTQVVGNRYRSVAAQRQKSVVTSSLHSASSFKVLAHKEQCFYRSHFGLYIIVGFFNFISLYCIIFRT